MTLRRQRPDHLLPGKAIDGRTMVYPQARVLGGGSSINAQVFTRGCPRDYDGWAADDGCAGWSYAEVLPYFIRSEGNDTFAGAQHGIDGPLGVSSGAPHPLTRVFVKAAQQAGLSFRADFAATLSTTGISNGLFVAPGSRIRMTASCLPGARPFASTRTS